MIAVAVCLVLIGGTMLAIEIADRRFQRFEAELRSFGE